MGQFVDNLREGQGTYTWAGNQGEYVGAYKAGERHTGKKGPNAQMTWQMPNGAPSLWVGKFENGACTKGMLNGREVDAADM